jgi:hypothetical protein
MADKINGYGVVFRFITPLLTFLLTIIGTLILGNLTDLRQNVEESKIDRKEIRVYFSNHLNHHADFEVSLERRLTCIETKLEKIWNERKR